MIIQISLTYLFDPVLKATDTNNPLPHNCERQTWKVQSIIFFFCLLNFSKYVCVCAKTCHSRYQPFVMSQKKSIPPWQLPSLVLITTLPPTQARQNNAKAFARSWNCMFFCFFFPWSLERVCKIFSTVINNARLLYWCAQSKLRVQKQAENGAISCHLKLITLL